jgi:large subunit ribosomal protein L10
LSLNRNEKEAVVADVASQVARAQTLAVAEYRGLSVENLNALRRQARDKGVYLHVLKNSLARRAVAGTAFEVAQTRMVGPLIYGFSEDAVAAARVLADYAKTNDKLVVMGGAYAGKALDADGVKALAAIPSKEVLLAQLLGLMQSPISRFARVLAAIAEKRAEPAAAEDAGETPAAETSAAEAPAGDAPAGEAADAPTAA